MNMTWGLIWITLLITATAASGVHAETGSNCEAHSQVALLQQQQRQIIELVEQQQYLLEQIALERAPVTQSSQRELGEGLAADVQTIAKNTLDEGKRDVLTNAERALKEKLAKELRQGVFGALFKKK